MIVTFFYFLAALAEQINVIVLGNSRHSYSTTTTTTSSTTSSSSSTTSGVGEENSLLLVPEYVMDILFLSWIYFAISNTIRILTQFKQTAKLRIYENLISIIAIFVLLSACVSILYILGKETLSFPFLSFSHLISSYFISPFLLFLPSPNRCLADDRLAVVFKLVSRSNLGIVEYFCPVGYCDSDKTPWLDSSFSLSFKPFISSSSLSSPLLYSPLVSHILSSC